MNESHKLKWIDTLEIAIQLADAHTDVDPTQVRFTALMAMVQALPEFDDVPERCGERILEAIQQAWIDEIE
jgi:FeS assembly protein IscX